MGKILSALLGRRERAATTVMPSGGGGGDSPGDDPDKDKDEPAADDGGDEDGEKCPDCGKSGDECSCGKAEGGDDEKNNTDEDDDKSGSSASVPHHTTDRSGDNDMGTNDKSAASNPLPALGDFRAVKSFGADAVFCVECVEKKRTLLEAHEAWAEKMTAEAQAANKRLSDLAKLGNEGHGGAEPVSAVRPGASSGNKVPLVPTKAPEPTFSTYQEYVAHYRSKDGGGLTDLQAHKKATDVCVAQGRGALKIEWFRALQKAEQDHNDRIAAGAPKSMIV